MRIHLHPHTPERMYKLRGIAHYHITQSSLVKEPIETDFSESLALIYLLSRVNGCEKLMPQLKRTFLASHRLPPVSFLFVREHLGGISGRFQFPDESATGISVGFKNQFAVRSHTLYKNLNVLSTAPIHFFFGALILLSAPFRSFPIGFRPALSSQSVNFAKRGRDILSIRRPLSTLLPWKKLKKSRFPWNFAATCRYSMC